MKKDWEVVHYGPTDWKGGGPSEKKHYSRHASIEEANAHARKLAHASAPKGARVEHENNADDPDDPTHFYYHRGDDRMNGDMLAVQKVGSQEKWEKDVDSGKASPDPEVMKKVVDWAFRKKSN